MFKTLGGYLRRSKKPSEAGVTEPETQQMIRCVQCDQIILDALVDGSHIAPCIDCNTAYIVYSGMPSLVYSSRHKKHWTHSFTLEIIGATKAFEIKTHGEHALNRVGAMNWGSDSPHRVSLVYTHRHGALEDLVCIQSHWLRTHTKLATPGTHTHRRASWAFLGVTAVLYAFWIMSHGLSFFSLLFVAALAYVACHASLRKWFRPRAESTSSLPFDIRRQKSLIDQKLVLLRRRRELMKQSPPLQSKIQSLSALHARMNQLDGQLYRSRIQSVGDSIHSMRRLLAHQAKVKEEMDRSLVMVDIEMEAQLLGSVVASSDTLTLQLAELNERERELEDLRLEIEARVEVESLLHA